MIFKSLLLRRIVKLEEKTREEIHNRTNLTVNVSTLQQEVLALRSRLYAIQEYLGIDIVTQPETMVARPRKEEKP